MPRGVRSHPQARRPHLRRRRPDPAQGPAVAVPQCPRLPRRPGHPPPATGTTRPRWSSKAWRPAPAPLQHLAWLIDAPVRTVALSGAGVLVNIPQPARFAVHKLILAQRRDDASRLKRAKDLAQAKALIEVLRDLDPFALDDALADARAKGEKGWRSPIARSLKEIGHDDLDA
nr:nucleotidyltransferase domain-containing protein [Phenylobacterium sp. J367]